MIVDVHTHIWPRGGSGDRLVAAMDAHGVDRSVVLAIDPSLDPDIAAPNAYVLEQCRRHPDRLLPFCSVAPDTPGAAETLERWVRDEGCRGLKLHPPLQAIDLAGRGVRALAARAAELGAPVLIHTGPVFTPHAPLIPDDAYLVDRLAADVPEATLILAHADPLGVAPVVAGRHENVYLDTAVVWPRVTRLVPGSGESALDFIATGGVTGWERLLFGSDANPDRYERVAASLASVRGLAIPEEQRRAILGGNACRVLGEGHARARP